MSGNAPKPKAERAATQGEKASRPASKPARVETAKEWSQSDGHSGSPSATKTRPKTDRRILKTRNTLGDALVTLMQEMPFDAITVQQVLDRAGVGRSTFYTHYTDKNDLFLSDVEEFFEMMGRYLARTGADLRRLAPVEEMFAHIADVGPFIASLRAAGKFTDVKTLGTGVFARSIAQRLRLGGVAMEPVQLAAQAHALAGSMFALVDWWLDRGPAHGMKPDAKAMDAMFHAMAWSGVSSAGQRAE